MADERGLKVAVINPLESAVPTGMAVAGDAVAGMVRDLGASERPLWMGRLFRFINDRVRLGPLKTVLRLCVCQGVPFAFEKDVFLVFTAHQAPLWRTGRHAVIIHDLISLAFPFQHRVQTLFFVSLLPRVLAAAERVVTISQATRDVLAQHLPLAQVRAAAVIPSYSERIGGPRHVDQPRQAQRFLCVGAKFQHKNLNLVLEAFQRLRSAEWKDAQLVVLGCDRSLWWNDHGGFRALEAEGWLTCESYAQDAVLRREYAECSALIYPSLAEGFGLPPLEAMSAGCPVICADIPVLRETCGEAAWYIDPHDPGDLVRLLEKLLGGQARAETVAKQDAAPEVIARFTRERIAGLWECFLRACASR
ncbi:MAG: hypothetical protein QOE70_1925 [Chthoniobacter sp.]|nr:hypothetical protein [Chthoniobacter sp.]